MYLYPPAAADKEWYVEGGWHGAANRGNSMRELCRECYVWCVPGHNCWLSEVSLQRSRNQHVRRETVSIRWCKERGNRIVSREFGIAYSTRPYIWLL